MDRIIGGVVLGLLLHRRLILIDDLGAAGSGVLFHHVLQLPRNDGPHPLGMVQNILQVGDLLLQFLGLGHPL